MASSVLGGCDTVITVGDVPILDGVVMLSSVDWGFRDVTVEIQGLVDALRRVTFTSVSVVEAEQSLRQVGGMAHFVIDSYLPPPAELIQAMASPGKPPRRTTGREARRPGQRGHGRQPTWRPGKHG